MRRLSLWLGWALATIFGILSAVFYSEAKREPNLSCFVKPVRSILIQRNRLSDLQVFYHGSELAGRVSGLELVIWNDGNRSIHGSDVLEPVIIRMNDGSRILGARMTRATRKLIGVRVRGTPDGRGIVVDWRVLEGQDGATIQIIYSGGPDADILVSGAIKGQRRIARLEAPEGPIYRVGFDRSGRRVAEVFMVFMILMSAYTLYGMWRWRNDSRNFRILGTMFLLVFIVVVIHEILYGYVEPPFGF